MLKGLTRLTLTKCKKYLKPSILRTSKSEQKKNLKHDKLNKTESSPDTRNTSTWVGGSFTVKAHSNRSTKQATSSKITLKIAASAEHAVKMHLFGESHNWRLSDIPESPHSQSCLQSSFSFADSMASTLDAQQQNFFLTDNRKSRGNDQLSSRERRAATILCKSVCNYPPFRIVAKNKTAMIAAAEFSEDCCMTEVFNFLCAVLEYQDFCKTSPREKQYWAFVKVADQFIAPGAPFEINIASNIREKLTKFMFEPAAFFAEMPKRNDRREVFQTVFLEMERVFWFNVYLRKHTEDQSAQELLQVIENHKDYESIHTTF